MANTYVKIYLHITFHVKSRTIPMREMDLERIFAYIGGIVRDTGGIALKVGGIEDHIHILAAMP